MRRLCRILFVLFFVTLSCVLVKFGSCLWISGYCFEELGITYRVKLSRYSFVSIPPTTPTSEPEQQIEQPNEDPFLMGVPTLHAVTQHETSTQTQTITKPTNFQTDKNTPKHAPHIKDKEEETVSNIDKVPSNSKVIEKVSLHHVTSKDVTKKNKSDMTRDEVALAIQTGEMCKSVCPPFEWSEWSPCSKACGHGHRYRKAIYQFVCPDHSEKCPDHRLEEEACDLPCLFDPSKYGGPDGLTLYPTNPLNPPIYPEARNYMCGHWISEYTALHKAIIKGETSPSYMVYSTGTGSYPTPGGLADRIKGITTVFFLSVLLDRAFLIEWLDPPGLTDHLLPKYFDWNNLQVLNNFDRLPPHDIGSWRAAKENGKSSQWYMNTNFTSYFTETVEVLQGNRYDYTFALLRNPALMPKAYELGLDQVRCSICCTFDVLFKSNPLFESSIKTMLSSINSPPMPYLSIHLRTKYDNVNDALSIADTYIQCALSAARELHITHPIMIPVFNNRLILHIMSKKYPNEIKELVNVALATRTTHLHLGNIPRDMDIEVQAVVQKRSFQDLYFMLNSTVLIRAKGYLAALGNIADAIRQHFNPPGSIITYTVSSTACTKQLPDSKIE